MDQNNSRKISFDDNAFDLPFKKQGDLRNSLGLLGVTPLWRAAQWVSLATPHHTIPALLKALSKAIRY